MAERVASLISGGGTTMCEVAKACLSGAVNAQFMCVIASTAQAGGIAKAKALGIPAHDVVVVDPQQFRHGGTGPIDRRAFGAALLHELRLRKISLVLQNGWMPLTPEAVIEAFPQRIFNQHPGPVPEFGGGGMFGRRVHAAVLLFRRWTGGEPWTEVIAQRVAANFDEGVVLKSRRIPIEAADTVDDLQRRALPFEHQLQVELLNEIVEGRQQPVSARPPLVATEHKAVWEMAKKAARLLYPKG